MSFMKRAKVWFGRRGQFLSEQRKALTAIWTGRFLGFTSASQHLPYGAMGNRPGSSRRLIAFAPS